jgi:hypothetical protein
VSRDAPSSPDARHPARRVAPSRVLTGAGALAAVAYAASLHPAFESATVWAYAWLPVAAIHAFGLPLAVMLLVLAVVRPRRTAGTVGVTERFLVWNGTPLFARRSIVDATAYVNGAGAGVRVRANWRTAFFEVDDLGVADRLVSELGKSPGRAILTAAEAEAGVFGTSIGSLGAAILMATLCGFFAFFSGLIWTVRWLAFQVTHRSWVIGSDGVLARSRFGADRYVPYDDVATVGADGRTLTVVPRSGAPLTLKCADDARASARPVVGSRSLARRILQAKAAAREAGSDAPVALVRGTRDVAEWAQALRGLDDRVATYRVAAVPREQLWSALEDVRQPAEIRAAAAAALAPGLADEEKTRLRVAADACASPKLRVAFKAAEARDDATLAEVLAEVDAESRARAARA